MKTVFSKDGRLYLRRFRLPSPIELHDVAFLSAASLALLGLLCVFAIGTLGLIPGFLSEKGIWYKMLMGSKVPCISGLLAVVVSLSVGVFLGALAGFWEGSTIRIPCTEKSLPFVWVITLFLEIIDSFPKFIFVLFFSAILPSEMRIPQIYFLMAIWGLLNTPQIAEIARRKALGLKRDGFITGAVALGLKRRTIFFRHLLWHGCRHILFIQATYVFGWAILIEATLSYLGISVIDSWGRLFADSVDVNFSASTVPALAIVATVFSLNVFGHTFRHLADDVLCLSKRSIGKCWRRLSEKLKSLLCTSKGSRRVG